MIQAKDPMDFAKDSMGKDPIDDNFRLHLVIYSAKMQLVIPPSRQAVHPPITHFFEGSNQRIKGDPVHQPINQPTNINLTHQSQLRTTNSPELGSTWFLATMVDSTIPTTITTALGEATKEKGLLTCPFINIG